MSEELEMQQRRLKARNALDDLSNMRGMGTELVTVIIPPDRAIHDVRPVSYTHLRAHETLRYVVWRVLG